MKRRSVLSRDKLVVIGEAVKKIPLSLGGADPEIAWRDMAGMRDVLIHAYFRTDVTMLYKTSKNRIPGQVLLLRKIYDDASGPP